MRRRLRVRHTEDMTSSVPTREASDGLDPKRDCQAIMRRLVGCEFPFDYRRSMIDLNFLKGLAAPRIAGPILGNGYLARFPQKRYDDTALFMMEFVKHGYDSPRGLAAIARMNQVHSHFRIRQEDYLYVLVGLMFEPVDWIDRYGWRPLTDTERQANYWFWRGVGERMDLTIIPPSYEAARQFKSDYEAEHFRRSRASVELVDMLFALVKSWVPRPLRPAVRPVMATLIDEPLFSCFDLDPPPAWLRTLVQASLRVRGRLAARFAQRRAPRFYMDGAVRSYPQGYAIADLGPPESWYRGTRSRGRAHNEQAADPRFCHHPPRGDEADGARHEHRTTGEAAPAGR